MSWLVSAKQYIPAVLGEPFGGGYFAGYISHTADGNPTHALIVAPRADGATGTGYNSATMMAWALNQNAGNGTNYSTTSIGTVVNGTFDGAANMEAFESIGIANFPGAEFCKNLSISGYTDWYLPSRFEIDIAYFNLKPTTNANTTSASTQNSYSVPIRTRSYTVSYPAQTYIASFNTSSEAFIAVTHLVSTEGAATAGRILNMLDGTGVNSPKTVTHRVRAFRKITL